VHLLRAKEPGGAKMPIIGNVDPINTMMLGTPEDVREEVMRDIADCADSANGYIVSTGCDIPVDAPLENIYAFMDAVREYGPTKIGEKK
jgi:uroporphyrinogen decarboxylase